MLDVNSLDVFHEFNVKGFIAHLTCDTEKWKFEK